MACYGARGGNGDDVYLPHNYTNGGTAYGEFYVEAQTKLYVYVGQQSVGNTGGWNGGAGVSVHTPGWEYIQSGGGGGTDIRYTPGPTPTNYLNASSIGTRIIVAGGGGGCEDYASGGGTTRGGHGGGFTGGNGTGDHPSATAGKGGTQTSGYAKGQGGPGTSHDAGCGGGGYYGGYGSGINGAGGGGSSFISGNPMCPGSLPNWTARTSNTVAGGHNYQSHNGDGWAQIVLIEYDQWW